MTDKIWLTQFVAYIFVKNVFHGKYIICRVLGSLIMSVKSELDSFEIQNGGLNIADSVWGAYSGVFMTLITNISF